MKAISRLSFRNIFISTLIFIVNIGHVNAGNTDKERNKEAQLICMNEVMKTAAGDKTVAEMREDCRGAEELDAIGKRILYEEQAASNPFAILPHNPNYILPYTYSKANLEPYGDVLNGEKFDNHEAKFQVSLKFQAFDNLFVDNLNLQFGFTATSWWQVFNSDISAPFRETNYKPELILSYNEPWSLFGLPVAGSFVSLTHESNGQSGTLSRSWNRIIAGVAVPSGDFVWSLKTWWRLPEDDKETPNAAKGDDNPDIEKYMGYGEAAMLWKLGNDNNLTVRLRNNLRSDNKGAVELGWSFPLFKHLRGYVEYFNGYGESLIYYNQHSERIGVGFKLTDWL